MSGCTSIPQAASQGLELVTFLVEGESANDQANIPPNNNNKKFYGMFCWILVKFLIEIYLEFLERAQIWIFVIKANLEDKIDHYLMANKSEANANRISRKLIGNTDILI